MYVFPFTADNKPSDIK
jgi:ATP-dependent DNA helicase Q1